MLRKNMAKLNIVRSSSRGSWLLVLSGFLLLGACRSSGQSGRSADSVQKPDAALQIASPAFENGGWIPEVYSCAGQNTSPELRWNGLPPSAKSLALYLEDPDTPHGVFIHWVIYNIPTTERGLTASLPATAQLPGGSTHALNGAGKTGYIGPCPPDAPPHRYFFRLFALDRVLSLGADANKDTLVAAMHGHILASGELMGRFQKKAQ